jgi:hypothetical protein
LDKKFPSTQGKGQKILGRFLHNVYVRNKLLNVRTEMFDNFVTSSRSLRRELCRADGARVGRGLGRHVERPGVNVMITIFSSKISVVFLMP